MRYVTKVLYIEYWRTQILYFFIITIMSQVGEWTTKETIVVGKGWAPYKPFSTENQPSNDAKREGWNRKKVAQRMMDDLIFKSEMTVDQFKEQYMQEIEVTGRWGIVVKKYVPKDSLTIKERQVVIYLWATINSEWWALNRMDRHVPMAPQKLELWEDSEKDNVDDILAKKAKDEILNLRSKKPGSSVG